jgi:quaternary ammonium compound-resistance protein SugE
LPFVWSSDVSILGRNETARKTTHNTRVAWLLLLIAGVMEVCWAVGLKYTEGFTRLTPTLLTVGAMVISIALLGLAVRELPIGTAYAVWTGIGAIGTVVAGTVLMNEPMSFARGFCILLILAGIIGLKFTHA